MKLLSFEPSNDGLEIQSVVVHVLEVETNGEVCCLHLNWKMTVGFLEACDLSMI